MENKKTKGKGKTSFKNKEPLPIKRPIAKLVDPYEDLRIFLSPVRCTMGGGPAGCFRVVGHLQSKVEELMSKNLNWDEIFGEIEIEGRKTNPDFIVKYCCRQTLQARTPYYDRVEGKPNTDDYTLLGTNVDRKAPYQVHGRWYSTDALKGPQFTGYTKDDIPTVQEADIATRQLEDPDDGEDLIIIDTNQLEDDDHLNTLNYVNNKLSNLDIIQEDQYELDKIMTSFR